MKCLTSGWRALLGAAALCAAFSIAWSVRGQEARGPATRPARAMTPGGKYPPGDMNRPRPPVVDPGTPSTLEQPGRPPSDAIILFDGKDLSKWERQGAGGRRGQAAQAGQPAPAGWKVENGYMEVVAGSGSIQTKESFGDCQLHIEWATPSEVKGNSQGRGNSGVFLFGQGELQVLDSFNNDTYPDGQAAALYNRYPPLVNASRKPGEWQMYDVVVEQPRFDADGQLVRPARVTVFHNGVVVHHATDTAGRAKQGPLALQDHGNPVRFRNIWVRKLKGYDER